MQVMGHVLEKFGKKWSIVVIPIISIVLTFFFLVAPIIVTDPFYLISFLAFNFLCFYLGFRAFKYYHLIIGIPTSKVRSLAIGLSEVKGIVHPFTDKLVAPFSRKECVLYKYMVEEYREGGRSSHWATVKEELKSIPFYLADETGKVLVDPRGAVLDVDPSYRATSPFPYDVENYLRSVGVSTTTLFLFPKKLRITEYCIPLNSELYVLGYVGDNPYKEEASAVFGHEDLMIQKHESEPFYLSTKSEKELVKKMRNEAIICLSAGVLGLSVLLYDVLILFL